MESQTVGHDCVTKLNSEHYSKYILTGLWKGVPKQKSLDKFKRYTQNPMRIHQFLERVYHTYRHYSDANPEASENNENGKHNLYWTKLPRHKKLTKVRWSIWNDPFSTCRCCFKSVQQQGTANEARRCRTESHITWWQQWIPRARVTWGEVSHRGGGNNTLSVRRALENRLSLAKE